MSLQMYKTLSGKEPAEKILDELRKRASSLSKPPHLAIVIVGEDKPSQVYVSNKIKTAERIGVETGVHRLPETVSEQELLALVEKLNKNRTVDGFIVQTPLPKQINTQKLVDVIDPKKDVDGYHPLNLGKVLANQVDKDTFLPATPFGVMKMLEYYNVQLGGKNAVVIGRSNTVGKPIAMLLLHRNATVTICHSKTQELAGYTANADIIIAAAGSPGLVKADIVKEGAYIIDVGTTRLTIDGKDKVVGDVDFESVIKKANCSPVPGGIGPLTVAMLLANVVKVADNEKK